MTLSLIVAMTPDRVIGVQNRLPWHISEDLKRFKKITMGHPIIMGRKTFDSIGKPLPGRKNIVLTRNPGFKPEGVVVVSSWDQAIQEGSREESGQKEQFVIGGSSLFNMALKKVDKIYLTLIHRNIPGDTFFPEFDWKNEYKILDQIDSVSPDPESLPYSFLTLMRKSPLN